MKRILYILAIALLIVGCTPDNEIKLGSILILTGDGAAWGEASRNGIDLAIQEINENGGINGKKITVNHQDDNSDPKKAVSAFRHLTEFENTNIIIGTTWSHTGLPLVDLADENQVLMVSPSLGVAEFNEGSDYLFNTWPHDFILSEKLADYVYEKGHTNVALISAQNVWVKEQTNAFTKRFEELGGTIELLVEPAPTDMNVNPEALKIKNVQNKITAIVSTTDGVLVGGRVAKAATELGVELPMFSITIDMDTIKAAQGAYEGMHFLTFLTPTSNFEQKYEAKFGKKADIGAASAYDAVMIIAEAIEKTGSEDPVTLQKYMNQIGEWNGASGNLVSDGTGAFTKPHLIKEVRNGVPYTISS